MTMTDKLAKRQDADLAKVDAREAESAAIMQGLQQRGVALLPGIDQGFRFRLPVLGKVRLGIKVQWQRRDPKTRQPMVNPADGTPVMTDSPKATEYFVLPPELLAAEKFMAKVAEMNPDPTKPTQLPIWLPCNQIPGNLSRSLDLYGSSKGLLCRSYDGFTCNRVDEQTGEWIEQACALHNGCPHVAKKYCRWIHRLRFQLPHAPGIGVWQIDTPSPNNWANLNCEMAGLGARMAGIDLVLTFEPREFQITIRDNKTNEDKLTKQTKYLLHIRSELNAYERRDAAKVADQAYEPETIEWDESHDDLNDLNGSAEEGDFEVGESVNEPIIPEAVNEGLIAANTSLLDELFGENAGMRKAFCKPHLRETPMAEASTDQLVSLKDALTARYAQKK